MDKRIPSVEQIKELVKEVFWEELIRLKQVVEHDSRIVSTEQEIIELSKIGFLCTPLGNGKWLMRKKILGQLPKLNLGKTYSMNVQQDKYPMSL